MIPAQSMGKIQKSLAFNLESTLAKQAVENALQRIKKAARPAKVVNRSEEQHV